MSTSAESTLLSLGKWGIISVKVPGFFPLSVKTSYSLKSKEIKTLSFNIKSLHAIYAMVLLALLTLWDLIFFVRKSSFDKYLKARGSTEIYAYTFMIALSSVLGVYFTYFGLRNPKRFLKFWKETCNLFQEVETKLDTSLFLNDEGIMGRFVQITKSSQRAFLALIIPVSIHVLLAYGYRIADSVLHEDGNSEDTEFALGLGFWTFFALGGSGISIWMCFFIQLYTACLFTVLDTITRKSGKLGLEIKKPDDYSHNMDELFSKVIQQPMNKPQSNNNNIKESSIESRLETSISVFQLILNTIDHFNEFFGVVIICEMSVCVLNLLVYLFFALVWMGRSEIGLLMETIVPIYIYGKELYDMGSYSEELTAASGDIVRAFGEEISLNVLSPHMHLKLQMLVTQVATNPPVISAKQFFIINRSLVTAVLSGLATFLVVLVQFRDADKP